jgi:hypothetical protein
MGDGTGASTRVPDANDSNNDMAQPGVRFCLPAFLRQMTEPNLAVKNSILKHPNRVSAGPLTCPLSYAINTINRSVRKKATLDVQ